MRDLTTMRENTSNAGNDVEALSSKSIFGTSSTISAKAPLHSLSFRLLSGVRYVLIRQPAHLPYTPSFLPRPEPALAPSVDPRKNIYQYHGRHP